MIRSKVWQVFQNIIRLAVTVGIPLLVLWQGGLLDDKAEGWPWWVIIGIGAFLGGVASTPASNITNLLWEILGIFARRGIEDRASKGYTKEECRVLRALEYRRWARRARKDNFFVVLWLVARRAILPALLIVSILFVPAVLAVFLVNPRVEVIPLVLMAIAVSGVALAVSFAIATALGIKSFYHQE